MSVASDAKAVKRHRVIHLLLGHGLATVCALTFALNMALIKLARAEVGPLELAAGRFWIAGGLVLVVWLIRGWPKWGDWNARTWRWVGLGALATGPGAMILLNTGASGVSTGMMGLLMATQALHLAWMGKLFLGEAVGMRQILALAVGFLGVALPLLAGGEVTYSVWWGPLLIACAAPLAGTGVIVPKASQARVKTLDLTTTLVLIGSIAFLPLMGIRGEFSQYPEIGTTTAVAIAFMGSFGHLGVVLLWFIAMRRLTAVTAALYLFVLMLASSGWGYVVLSEVPHWSEAVAALIVVAALRVNAAGGRSAGRGEVEGEFDPLAGGEDPAAAPTMPREGAG